MPRTLLSMVMTVVGALGLAACSSSEADPNDGASAPPRLVGDYQATAPGPMVEIAFADGQYTMLTNDCGASVGPCRQEGTFSLDAARGELHLTRSATGQTSTIAFHVLQAQRVAATSVSSTLHIETICFGTETECPNSGQLVTPNSPTVTPAQQPLVTCSGNCVLQFSAGGQLLKATGKSIVVYPNR